MDSSKFHDLFRIESSRLINWDYSRPGWYFVTICTKNKIKYFGDIIDEKMCLSTIGEIAKRCWLEIPKHFDNCKLREFIVMPNHVHGVIDITDDNCCKFNNPDRSINSVVETHHDASLHKLTTRGAGFYSLIANKSTQCIPLIVKQYKSAVSKVCHEQNLSFVWQPRFYDHVIRDEYSLYFIEEYIRDNLKNWKKDPMFKNAKIDWSKIKIEIR